MTLYTISEASKKLRMSVAWLRQKIFRREIPYHRIGRRVFISENTIEEILKSSIVQPEKKLE